MKKIGKTGRTNTALFLLLIITLFSCNRNIKENAINGFNPISVDREDGIYATVDYVPSANLKDVKLENKPTLSLSDFQEVVKSNRAFDNLAEIVITLTVEGAQKFQQLTKENIKKPFAIVVDKQIVSLPIIQAEIEGGKLAITGNFSDKEIDKMIERLKR
jgi:preprotein translocase subunit SecD